MFVLYAQSRCPFKKGEVLAAYVIIHHGAASHRKGPISEQHQRAMTTQAPDPRGFKSWEDAFQYPIPTVRGFEQQLRSNASEDREKLRTLVGFVHSSRQLENGVN